MSGDACDFNNIETQVPPPQSKARKGILPILTEISWEHVPSYATIKNWVAHFKRSDFSTCDVPRPG